MDAPDDGEEMGVMLACDVPGCGKAYQYHKSLKSHRYVGGYRGWGSLYNSAGSYIVVKLGCGGMRGAA